MPITSTFRFPRRADDAQGARGWSGFLSRPDDQSALADRLQAIRGLLLGVPSGALEPDAGYDAGALLDECVRAVQSDLSSDRVWLLCTAVFGCYPTAEDVAAAVRYLELHEPAAVSSWLLQRADATRAAMAEEGARVFYQELLNRRARIRSQGADASWPARGEAAALAVVVRVPGLRRMVRIAWPHLRVARARVASAVSHRHPLRGPEAYAPGPEVRGLQVVGGVVVDVDHTARHELHTGIQQVVRRTLPVWDRDHAVLAVAWTDDRGAWRTLTSSEYQRVLRRGVPPPPGPDHGGVPTVVVPWRSVIVLAETPPPEACPRLAALAQYSGNIVVAIGYDCIPVVSGDLVPAYEPQRFARYLTVLKYAHRIVAISNTAASEFAGFASALPAQGLEPPAVLTCPLPTGPAAPAGPAPSAPASPTVVCVASLEPRKNHLALLYAAERLWREGLQFQVLLIAGSGWGNEVPDRIGQLQQAGRAITVRRSATDDEVEAAYRTARFSVLPSLHEGYGLPVAESLAWGTPVITTDYGSTREVAAAGGALLVDPRHDEALVDAMRRLLTDDVLLETLRQQARARPSRTWEDFAAELWDQLVVPVASSGPDQRL